MMFQHEKGKSSSASAKIIRQVLALIPVLAIALVSYSVTVYAWFQASLVNSGNSIQVGQFEAQVKILDGEGNELWSSGEEGITSYTTPAIALPDNYTGEAKLIVTNLPSSTLEFQYQAVVTAGKQDVRLTVPKTAPLSIGKQAEHSFTIPAGATELQLVFRTAFKNNTMESLTVSTTAQPAEEELSLDTTVSTTATSTSGEPTESPASTTGTATTTSAVEASVVAPTSTEGATTTTTAAPTQPVSNIEPSALVTAGTTTTGTTSAAENIGDQPAV